MDKIHIYQYGIYKKETGNGVNQFLYRLAELLKNDFCIHFINFDLEDASIQRDIQIDESLCLHIFGKVKYMGFYFPKKFIEWLDSVPSKSVFHLHSVFRPANFALARILYQKRIPFIFTPHDSYSPESIQKKWLLKKILLQTTEKYLLNKATRVHAITEIGKTHLTKLTNNPVVLIHNFIDAPPLLPSSSHTHSIYFLGRFDWYQKGIDIQIKVYREFIEETKQAIPFVLIGSGKEKECLEVKKMIHRQGLIENKQVFLLGFLKEKEKWNKLNECYVYMQLSRYEGFSYSVVEAMSIGKPVIISSCIPIAKYVAQYNAGFVVDNDAEALTALKAIFSLTEKAYHQMSLHAKKCYQENFHQDIIYPHLINLYTSVFSDEIQGNLPQLQTS